ncbi:MAG: hypothetical protein AAFP19_25160 [Bacteroidota bacterium]
MIFKRFFLLFLLFHPLFLSAQVLNGIGTKWSDEFTEWMIFVYSEEEEEEEEPGELRMRWQMQNDWSEWDYRIGDQVGSIKQLWKEDPTQWEIRGDGEVITVRTKWSNDFSEWRITDNERNLTLRSRWRNNFNEWLVSEKEYGAFEIYTRFEDDPREWDIVDELDDSISLHLKMAFIFIAIYHSSPRY